MLLVLRDSSSPTIFFRGSAVVNRLVLRLTTLAGSLILSCQTGSKGCLLSSQPLSVGLLFICKTPLSGIFFISETFPERLFLSESPPAVGLLIRGHPLAKLPDALFGLHRILIVSAEEVAMGLLTGRLETCSLGELLWVSREPIAWGQRWQGSEVCSVIPTGLTTRRDSSVHHVRDIE